MAVKKGILPFVCVTDLADYVSSDLSGKVFSEPSRPAMLEFVMVSWQRFWFFFFFFFFLCVYFFLLGFVFCLLLFLWTLLRSLQGDDRLLCKDLFVRRLLCRDICQ